MKTPSNKATFLYPPYWHPGRAEWTPDKYTDHQEHVYQALSKVVYYWEHGLLPTLRPHPMVPIDREDFEAWKLRALDAWRVEAKSRGKGRARPIVEEDFPDNAWRWLYQQIRAAPPKSPLPANAGSYEG